MKMDSFPFWSASLLVACFVVSLVIIIIRPALSPRSGGKGVPSPPRLPVIGNLHQLGSLPHRSLRELSEKYGGVMEVRLGQTRTVVVSSPEAVREIFKKHDVAFSDRPKSTASDVLFYEGKNIAFSHYNQEWRQARKICTLQLLSQKRVHSFGSVRQEEVGKLVGRLREAGLRGETVNLSKLLMLTSNDITARCIIGQRYSGSGFLGDGAKKVTKLLVALCVGDLFPCLKWVDWVRGFTGRLRSTAEALDSFYSEVVEEHRKAKDDHAVKDFVDILLEVEDELASPVHMKAILQDMLLAGVETSSTTMEWMMAELLKHPRVMKKVQDELRRLVNGPETDDLGGLVYFNCVLKETLRLHPPFPLLLPRQTLSPANIDGYDVPANTRVLVNCWAIQRHTPTWDRPDDFIPERFLDNPDVDFKTRDCFHFIPFGFGRRECPGMAFGTLNVQYLISNLLYSFDWNLHPDHQDFDMTEAYGITVNKKLPILVVPKPYSP